MPTAMTRSVHSTATFSFLPNTPPQGESYARPTSVTSYDAPHSRRSHSSSALSKPFQSSALSRSHSYPPFSKPSQSSAPSRSHPSSALSKPSQSSALSKPPPPHRKGFLTLAFPTLSSVAIDEPHALERLEALHRAENEVPHAAALQRAAYEAPFGPFVSEWFYPESQTTSPFISPSGSPRPEDSPSPMSSDEEPLNIRARTKGFTTNKPIRSRVVINKHLL